MKSYDPNICFLKQTIKVTLQQFEYSGYFTFEINGNCKGLDVLNIDFDTIEIDNIKDNQIDLNYNEEYDGYEFHLYKNGDNADNDIIIEDATAEDISDMVVKIEIIEAIPEK